ncbi:MAG: TetR/AcrR family transcriptional regulator [Aggregatilineales bacterium]
MSESFDGTPKGGQARVEILVAARRLFLTQGYGQTTIRDIAKASGRRAPGGIYNHFSSKEAIFQTLIAEHNPADELLAVLESSRGDTAPEMIRNILRKALPIIVKHYEFVELAQIDWREFQGKNLLQLMRSGLLLRILSQIDRIQRLPGLKPIEPFVLARLMASHILGYLFTWRLGPPPIIVQLTENQWIETYIEALLHGIGADREQPKG